MLLVIMDTFKGQDDEVLKELCGNNFCEVVIVLHNLKNNFQPLDKSFNIWMTNEVSNQLKRGISLRDLKIALQLEIF